MEDNQISNVPSNSNKETLPKENVEAKKELTQPQGNSAPKKTEEKKSPAKTERPANCPVCNKSIKEKWFYRNGGYYCGKGCFKQARKKAGEKQNAEKKS